MTVITALAKARRVRVGKSQRIFINAFLNCDINKVSEHYTKIANYYLSNNGPKWTCARLKAYYTIGVKISLNTEFENIPYCKTSKDNIPLDLVPFLKFLRSPNINNKRAGLTVLRFYTQIYCKVSEDVSSIESIGPEQSLFQEFEDNFRKVCEKYKRVLKPELRDEPLFVSSKAGPNGRAMLDAEKDYYAIRDTDIFKTIKLLNQAIEKVAIVTNVAEVDLNTEFYPEFRSINLHDSTSFRKRAERKQLQYNCMDNVIDWRLNLEPDYYNKSITSRIRFIPEGGCKTRVIAIGDYFTQDSLKPIHKSIYRMLRKISSDGTYSHNRISEIVKEKTSKGSVVWSFDLTNATDRFPIFIQTKAMSILYNPEIANLWSTLMVDRDFVTADRVNVRYNCGQPMGFLSSWGVFAICHHIIIVTCALNVGIEAFRDYVVIGDDVNIFNSKVAIEYKRFLKTFNIEISEAKSMVSDGKPSFSEIAKRIFISGEEISPIPYDAVESAIKDYLLVPNLFKLCIDRGILQFSLDTNSVQSTLKMVYKKNSTVDNVLAILSYPNSTLPFRMSISSWDEGMSEEIQHDFDKRREALILSKAKSLYNKELTNIPNIEALRSALETDDETLDFTLHPLIMVLRGYRARCVAMYQALTIYGLRLSDVDLIPFLVDPMIPSYMRMSHQIERIKSSLIIKTFKEMRIKYRQEDLYL